MVIKCMLSKVDRAQFNEILNTVWFFNFFYISSKIGSLIGVTIKTFLH